MSLAHLILTFFIVNSLQWNFKTYPGEVSIGQNAYTEIWVKPATDGTVSYFFDVTDPSVVLKNKKILQQNHSYKVIYTYAIFATQPVTIKGIGFRWIPKKGKEEVHNLPPVKIKIKLITKKGDKPLPPSSMIPVEVFNWNFVVLLTLLILLIGGIFAGRAYFKNRQEVIRKEEIKEPPELIAERRLNELLNSPHYQKKKWKEFFLALTEITKDYLAEVFDFSAQAETSFEIITELKIKKLSSDDMAMIRNFFEKSDLIKFAKYQPTEEEVQELISAAKKIIKLGMKYHEV